MRTRLHMALVAVVAFLVAGNVSSMRAAVDGPAEAVPEVGDLLVARPGRVGATFDRTLVLIVERTGRGTTGLVVNRREPPAHLGLSAWPEDTFWGGPLQPDARFVLAPSRFPGATWVGNGLWYANSAGRAVPDGSRRYRGWAGWIPGQLEAEIAAGAWLVVRARPEVVFSDTPSWAEEIAAHLRRAFAS